MVQIVLPITNVFGPISKQHSSISMPHLTVQIPKIFAIIKVCVVLLVENARLRFLHFYGLGSDYLGFLTVTHLFYPN
jgi:hypothetical protein